MAKSTRVKRARDAVDSTAHNAYLRRVIEDDDLRESFKTAVDAARDAYERLSSNGKGPINTAIDDKKVHKDLKTAAENLRNASDRLRGKREKHTLRRIFFVGLIGAVLAIALSEDLRKTVLDKLFGAEEEFEYTSTTTPTAPSTPAEPATSDAS